MICLKKYGAFVLCLALLAIPLLLVAPGVSAVDISEGVSYRFASVLSSFPTEGSYSIAHYSQNAVIVCDGVPYFRVVVSSQGMRYDTLNDAERIWVYDASTNSWADEKYRNITFTALASQDNAISSGMLDFLLVNEDPSFNFSVYDLSGDVVIDNVSSADPIVMAVSSTGATFQLTDQTLSYTYTGTEIFAGFAASASGSATYTPGNTYTLDASATSLYAKETARPTYQARFYGLTGSLAGTTAVSYSPLSLSVTSSGGTITLADGSPLTFTYTGDQIFAGFATSSGGAAVYFPGETYTLSSALTLLYAKETPRPTYSITLYDVSDPEPVGDATFLDPIQIKVTSSGATFSSGIYSFDYVYSGTEIFTGFATSAGGTPVYVPGNSYTITAPSTVLYAVEKDRPVYTLTLYDETGQPVVGPLTSYEPISFSIGRKSATFFVNGSEAGSWSYTGSDSFIGFATSPDSEDVPYRPGSSYTPTSLDTKLYVVSRFIDPGVIGDILDVFTGLGDVSVSLLLLLCGLFWAADTGLTFLGVVALAGVGFGICLVCFYLVSKYRS